VPRSSPTTECRSPARSSCPTRSRTWAPKLVPEVADKTSDLTGDGTTTATLLAPGDRRRGDDTGLAGDYLRGAQVIPSVLSEPLFWASTNAGYDGQAVVDQVRTMPPGHGLNALTGEFGVLAEGLARPSSPV
jgi:chaperonin GroEL (HSP60 family)